MSSLNFILSKFDESIVAEFQAEIEAPIQGQFVVNVPDGVQLETPITDYTDLKTKKHDGILAVYADYTDQIFDEFDFDTRIDFSDPDDRSEVGKYEVRLPPAVGTDDGFVTSVAQAMGYTPTDLIVLWTVYRIDRTENDYGGFDQTYVELDPSDVDVEVSVDGGSNWDTATFGELVTPTVAGSSFKIRFTNTNAEERYIGYYSMLYRP